MEFYTIKEHTEAEIIEKKSRFIANAYCIESKEEAEAKIKQLKKKYYDAKHNCFAFSVLENGKEFQKCSDDGEPSGTAGSPILNVIKKNNLQNILIVVTRYFGGILLGTGGLTRAYSEAAIKALESSNIAKKEEGLEVMVEISYVDNEKFKYYCGKNNINIVKTDYNENILHKIELNENEYQKLIENNKSNNEKIQFKLNKIEEKCRKFIDKEK